MVSRYVTNGPVKDGICLLPPTHYRMMPPQRADGFHVNQSYVPQQQPNQPGSQAQNLRAIAPTGPSTQASTPPTNDLKVQSVPQQQQSMNHMYVGPQQQVRGTQGPYYRPTNQAPRMPNQHRVNGQQQIFPQQAASYLPMTVQAPMYITNTVPYAYNGQRPQHYVQSASSLVYPGQIQPSHFAYPQNSTQTPPVQYQYYPIRQPHPPQPATVPPNAPQNIQNITMQQATAIFPTSSTGGGRKQQRRANAIPVIDPDTGVDRLTEVLDEQNSSHPPSGESSARQTPQLPVNTEIRQVFAKQVFDAVNNDISLGAAETELQNSQLEQDVHYHPTNPANATSKLEHIVQSSNLKVQAKEFVSSSNTAKEPPTVSALCDSVEVTLPNKPPKDRESPAKGRKQQQQQPHKEQFREHKDSLKDNNKEKIIISEKESSNSSDSRNNKTKESILPTVNNVAAAAVVVNPTAATGSVTMSVPVKDNFEVVNTMTTSQQRDDKKINQKKDSSKTDTNVPSVVDSTNDSCSNVAMNNQPAQEHTTMTGKSKNAQRTKDGPKQQVPSTNQKQQVPATVPPPQPAKPSSKTSKKSEINQKGASKEGTDMDAFNDNIQVTADNANINNEINANTVITNSSNDAVDDINTVHQNNTSSNNEAAVVVAQPPPPPSSFKNDNNTKSLPKKVDITDIVKEIPKPIKSFPQQQTLDEIDRAVPLSNKQIVQAKNEANAKVSPENNGSAVIDTKPELPYREGQWTPNNLDGKKVYDKEFLMAVRQCPASKKKPDNLPDMIAPDERGRLSDGRYSTGGRTDFITPPFPSYNSKSSSQRGTLPAKRNSQSGKLGGGGGKSGSKQQQIKVSISVREDVKLHEAENAWRPARFTKREEMSEDDLKTEQLYKKVRGVLNKLTPQKFETLVGQVRDLQIDNERRLQGVIDLVFEKAVDEPSFSVAYAYMCRELGLMQVPTDSSTEERKEYVQFRKLLITRCQLEFEKQSRDESVRKEKLDEIAQCADPEKKKELEFDLEDYDRRLRMKSVGNIRFIGELFKQQMLTVTIMIRCLNNLLVLRDEESLECLCKLIATVGKELEKPIYPKTTIGELNEIINQMKSIVDGKSGKEGKTLSSRVRFMLQDVIDLRRNHWVPRRQDLNPKTMDQIQKEAENEQMNIQVMNSMTPRKDERASGLGSNTDRRRQKVSDDGWQTTPTARNRIQFQVQIEKMKYRPPQTDEPLGSRQTFGAWSKGSGGKAEATPPTNSANFYAALENYDTEKRSSGFRSKDPYSSKGPSLERNTNYNKQSFDGRGSRSGSQHRSTERDSSLPPQVQKLPQPTTIPIVNKQPVLPPVSTDTLSEEKLSLHVRNNLDEFLNESMTVEEYTQDTLDSVPTTYLPRIVADGYLYVIERSATARLRTGFLFAKLITNGLLPLNDYCTGLEEVLTQADELQIDIPMFWTYLGEILVHLICEEALPLEKLYKLSDILCQQGHGSKLLGPLFKLVVSEKGPNFLANIWRISRLRFEDFMSTEQVDDFLRKNQLDFLLGGEPTVYQNQVNYEQIYKKLLEFFNAKTEFDDVVNWITANVGQQIQDNKFIRTLVTAVLEHSIPRQKLAAEHLKAHYKLLQKYVDNTPNFELQCLYALQALIQKLEHPKGLLLTICNQLYEDSMISQDSFIAWEMSEDPCEKEGKGVALKQLTSFFTQLKENEDSASGSSSDET